MMQAQWQIAAPSTSTIPLEFLEAVRAYTPYSEGKYAAQLLWKRGIKEIEELPGFFDPERYLACSPFEFGQEMKQAVRRLLAARDTGERVTIWGDFDADGVTSTSVLWEGLGQFLPQELQLNYYIPDRFTESHGLNCEGIDRLAAAGTTLIVTCDTGSTNLREIEAATALGIDLIITDHHALPPERPEVVAIINPRYFAETHPFYHLSGVAVAYKLVEAMYATLPEVPQQPLEDLLDLVAIGLIADLVALKGDCRYLAQRGLQQLRKQSVAPTRPGVAKLLELCKRSGDRPTDISFGIGPRINAVSRIHGDARFCVELLTSRDRERCEQLALETELANSRRKELQKTVAASVKRRLEQIDLSTTSVIVLEDPQWSGGVLGLVAGQMAQEYGRPTVLLSRGEEDEDGLARGSARSIREIDFYELVKSQAHLLHRFGGHPFAAGLSLPVENIPLFRDAIDRELRAKIVEPTALVPTFKTDLTVTVAELGKELFRELNLLEPYGMGNPIPQLLIKNCWFKNAWNKNITDAKNKTVSYLKTTFKLCDESRPQGIAGMWWGHSRDELPLEGVRCDAIVELDFNTYSRGEDGKGSYEARLVAVRVAGESAVSEGEWKGEWMADWRGKGEEMAEAATSYAVLRDCPSSWRKLQGEFNAAVAQSKPLALAYPSPESPTPEQVWRKLIGIAKHLDRTATPASLEQIAIALGLSRLTLESGLEALKSLGFELKRTGDSLSIRWKSQNSNPATDAISLFLLQIEEEQFRQGYFYRAPVETLQAGL
ncbi:single-stranded-DNA-specific exonuclease RecJ [Oscillatoria sp. FACHB-1406]|uniref:single-stranded-DNA-specific exonuclease RecJ n=1 Tax=Oscillatoria sp. FACHB-1406 TaxID=2692846 RepID=UPI0016822A20|nr:single-stranded-DNA-specific exonuclease RecJ [Oscillatoria sp. FACHB-1406]MBD2577912.1 single-stranded-DNA-specific exonuclease RecJ [Oscillatoria sp. FACHB-1406]